MGPATHEDRRGLRRAFAALAIPTALAACVFAVCVPRTGGGQTSASTTVVLGYNDLGMHCLGQDFSELCILPPYNNLHAQVIDRSGESPQILTEGVTVGYSVPGNTYSAGKTNFWQYAPALFGTKLPPNIGLTGSGLAGTMQRANDNEWVATGIPITPIQDNGAWNPYQLATITARRNGTLVGATRAVVPVSWEMSCNLCHNTPGISTATDILRAHDRLHHTQLESHKPVLCASCHSDNALSAAGATGVESLSRAMHNAHAPRMAQAGLTNACYACHPGVKTQCLRDVHYLKGMTCTNCHGSMTTVADAARRPWIDEPRCGNCHSRPGFQFEQPDRLYKESIGHHGVRCASCHGSPHAITPTAVAADNVQAIGLQGHAGTIDTCTVCHRTQPEDPFPHSD